MANNKPAKKKTLADGSISTPTPAKRKCFVICPIGADGSEERKRSDQLLKHILEPVCEKYGYECIRADRLPNPGIITNQIMELLVDSELVIADLTGKNPNVFYELGIRHCAGKPFIQVMFGKVEVPFDIGNVRTTSYSLDVDAIKPAQEALANQIDWILKNPDKVINPVSLAVNLGTLLGGNRTEQILAQMADLVGAVHKKVGEIEDEVSSIRSDVEDVEFKVNDLEDQIDDIQNS